MNALFYMDAPENRRQKKKRDQLWEAVPKIDRPHCRICGAEIPFEGDTGVKHWKRRVVCKKQDDHKELTCYRQYMRLTKKAKPRVAPETILTPAPHWKKPQVENSKPRVVMSQEEADRLDAEQCRINIECHKRTMERCGYVHSPCRRLNPEEIEAINHTISPICSEKCPAPQYRSWLPRGSAQC